MEPIYQMAVDHFKNVVLPGLIADDFRELREHPWSRGFRIGRIDESLWISLVPKSPRCLFINMFWADLDEVHEDELKEDLRRIVMHFDAAGFSLDLRNLSDRQDRPSWEVLTEWFVGFGFRWDGNSEFWREPIAVEFGCG